MAISLIPYKKQQGLTENITRTIKESYREFLPAAAIVLLVFGAYAGFWVFQHSVKARVEALTGELDQLVLSLSSSKIDEVKKFAQQARGLNSLVQDHVYSAQLFSTFNKSTHNNVLVESFKFDQANKVFTLQGSVPDFETLGEQFLIWHNESDFISEIVLKDFGEIDASGRLHFSADLTINERYLKK